MIAVLACLSLLTAQAAKDPQPSPEIVALYKAARALPLKERIPAYEKALVVAEVKKDLPGQAILLSGCGVAATRLSMFTKALEWDQRALTICRQVGYQEGLATTLGNIGLLYGDFGDIPKAIDYSEQALALDRAMKEEVAEATVLSNLGLNYETLGKSDKALEYFQSSLVIAKRIDDAEGQARDLNNIGGIYADRGERGKALQYFQSSLDLSRAKENLNGEAFALDNMGGVWSDLGDYNKSLDLVRQSLKIRIDLGDVKGQATNLANIGMSYLNLDQTETALANFQKSLALLQGIEEKIDIANVLGDIGAVYDRESKFPEALDYYSQALNASLKTGQTEEAAVMYNNLGELKARQGSPTEAIEHYNKALPLLRQIQDHPDEAQILANLGDAFRKDHPEGAISFYKRSVNTYQSLRKNISGLDKQIQAGYRRKVSDAYRKLSDLCAQVGRIEEAEQVLDLLKDDEFFQFIRTRAGTRPETVDLTPKEKDWSNQYEALGDDVTKLGEQREAILRINPEARTEDQKAQLTALRPKLDAAGKAFQSFLNATQEAFAGVNADTERLQDLRGSQTLDRVLKKLPNHPAAIYTLLTQDGVRVILSIPNLNVPRQAKVNIPAAQLNKKILAFREALTDPTVDPRPLGSELYELLVRPIEKDLQNAHCETLMWSLDSTLRYIPVWALYDKETAQFMIQKYPSSLFTPRTVDRLTEDPHPWTGASFGVSKGATVQGATFPDLPSVEPELAAVQKILGGPALLNQGFTLDSLRNALDESPRVVHLATHFRFKPGDSLGSFLLLGNSQPLSIEQFSGLSEGLLSNVDLLVLSACQTAVGSENADGSEFESFALIAQLKGAAAVMATLWPVADESTAALMGRFYTLRKAHPEWTKLGSLREAQLELIRGELKVSSSSTRSVQSPALNHSGGEPLWPASMPKFAHPYYWAPFVLIGNWK